MTINVYKPLSMNFYLHVQPADTIATVKAMIHAKKGIPRSEQRLQHLQDEDLEDGRTLMDYNILNGDMVTLHLRGLRGGAGKRKVMSKEELIALEVGKITHRVPMIKDGGVLTQGFQAAIEKLMACNDKDMMTNAVDKLTDEQAIALEKSMADLNNTAVERVIPVLTACLLPEVAAAQKQQDALKAAVEALQSSVMRCFIMTYYNDDRNIIDMKKFLTIVKNRPD